MSNSGTLTNLVNELRALGTICREQGDLKRAEQHFRLALNLYESSFPDDHENAMLCLLQLVQVLDGLGKHKDARLLEASIPVFNARRRGC